MSGDMLVSDKWSKKTAQNQILLLPAAKNVSKSSLDSIYAQVATALSGRTQCT